MCERFVYVETVQNSTVQYIVYSMSRVSIEYSRVPVLHKVAAEVSKKRKHIGEVGCCESRMAERFH